MGYRITIDAGTTNTRMLLLDESRSLLAESKASVGVRDTAVEGNNHRLARTVRDGIANLLDTAKLTLADIRCILASGMITSNMGLVEIPHLTAPVGLDALAAAVRPVLLKEVCEKPIHFIPGIKNAVAPVDIDSYAGMDIMRGEEVESFALLSGCPSGKRYLLVLPGSHTKFVAVDERGWITGCVTTLSGELLNVITKHTIVANAVESRFARPDSYDRQMALRGYAQAKRAGLSRAAFSARILSQFAVADAQRIASFLLGAVLYEDIAAIRGFQPLAGQDATVLVSGKEPLRTALYDLLVHDGYYTEVRTAPSAVNGLPLSALGACLVEERLANTNIPLRCRYLCGDF